MPMDIFQKNRDFLTPPQMEKISSLKVAVVGAGALGQMAAQELVRSGFENIILIDGDIIEASNFNRQIDADVSTLGQSKVQVLTEHLKRIHGNVRVTAVDDFLDKMNGKELLDGAEVILDCVDDISVKLLLEKLAEELGVLLIHGAVEGWYGQVAAVYPGEGTLTLLYGKKKEQKGAALMATVGVVASLQVSEAMKAGMQERFSGEGKVLFVDLLQGDFSYMILK